MTETLKDDPTGRYLVRYPSGSRFRLDGDFHAGPLGDAGVTPGVIRDGGDIVMLDPRGIIRDLWTGALVYHPSLVRSGLSREMRAWLDEHPAWERQR